MADMTRMERTETMGIGIFAERPIHSGDTIEWCPVVMMPSENIRGTPLAQYVSAGFTNEGVEDMSLSAVVLGWGMLLNHSFTPSVSTRYHYDMNLMEYYALTDIAKDEQVFIDYGYDLASCFHDVQRQWYVDLYCQEKSISRSDLATQLNVSTGPVSGIAQMLRSILGIKSQS